jgi:hypothetical protein
MNVTFVILLHFQGGEGLRCAFRIMASAHRGYFTEDNMPSFEAGLKDDLNTIITEIKEKEAKELKIDRLQREIENIRSER